MSHTVGTLVADWLAEKSFTLAESSLRQYRTQLAPLVQLYGQLPVAELTRERLRQWLQQQSYWQPGEPKSTSTQRIITTVLQQWLNWLVEFEYLPACPLKPSDLKKPAAAMRKALPTATQIQKLLEVSAQRPDWQRLFKALRLTGCRPSELINAQIHDLELADGEMLLNLRHHKTVKKTGARQIPLSPPVQELILEAIGNRQAGPIFTTYQGRKWIRPCATRLFRQFARQAKLPAGIVLYTARHEFGTKVTELVGIAEAKELLGHTSIQTTQRYTHPSLKHLTEVQRQAAAALQEHT